MTTYLKVIISRHFILPTLLSEFDVIAPLLERFSSKECTLSLKSLLTEGFKGRHGELEMLHASVDIDL